MIIQLKKMSISACTLWSTSFIIKIPHCDALNCKGTVDIMLSSVHLNVWASFFIWIQSLLAEPWNHILTDVPQWVDSSKRATAVLYPEKFCTQRVTGIYAGHIAGVNYNLNWLIMWFQAQVYVSQFLCSLTILTFAFYRVFTSKYYY